MGAERSYLRDTAIWTLVTGAHVLVLVLLLRLDRQPAASPEVGIELYFVELSPPELNKETESATLRPSAPRERRERPAADPQIAAPAQAPDNRPIDWYGAAEDVARDLAAKGAQPGPRAFGEQPRSPYRTCKPRESSFVWDPEPNKFGIEGLIPFFRLGERCVAGLGFFGCSFGGKPPGPNAHLFDDMHDPHQPNSSVPDADPCAP